VRLTRQRWETIVRAMNFWEAEVEDMEVFDHPDASRERRQFESAMEYVMSIEPIKKESK